MARWRGWWRIVRVDQWGVFFVGACSAWCCRRCSTSRSSRRARTSRVSASAPRWRRRVGATAGPMLGARRRVSRRVDAVQDAARHRRRHDALRSPTSCGPAAARVRRWRGGDVRAVYYTVLAVVVVWGIIALSLAQPIDAAADRRQRRRGGLRDRRRCTCSTSTRGCCRPRCARRCGGGWRWWAWRCSTGSSSRLVARSLLA